MVRGRRLAALRQGREMAAGTSDLRAVRRRGAHSPRSWSPAAGPTSEGPPTTSTRGGSQDRQPDPVAPARRARGVTPPASGPPGGRCVPGRSRKDVADEALGDLVALTKRPRRAGLQRVEDVGPGRHRGPGARGARGDRPRLAQVARRAARRRRGRGRRATGRCRSAAGGDSTTPASPSPT